VRAAVIGAFLAAVAYYAYKRAADGAWSDALPSLNAADYAPVTTAADDSSEPAPVDFEQPIQLAGAGIVTGIENVIAKTASSVRALWGAHATAASPDGVAKIATWETFQPRPYQDLAGYWTIGYGHKIKPGESFVSITEDEARALLARDTADAQAAINSNVKQPLTQPQYDALTSLVFNIGGGAFSNSTLLQKLNAGDFAGAADQFTRWVYAGGQRVNGLYNRRVAESQLFASTNA
jgi:lysozyme